MEKKHVLIAVSGGIAAYKACDIVSSLCKKDLEVRVIETANAAKFVAPITFESLCKNKVETDLFDYANQDPIAHISLAKWADLVAVVPATANIMAKAAYGIADDLVSTTLLACYKKKMMFPAMNVHMFENPATQRNMEILKQDGWKVVEPVCGHLACDDTGKGKLPAVADIVEAIVEELEEDTLDLAGKKVLVSAGPTQEPLDPVRFISNHSSGKQGYAIAKAAKKAGADVTLVSGPVDIQAPEGVEIIAVKSARDMFNAITSRAKDFDYVIMAAAVGDYRPKEVAPQKIKKDEDSMLVEMVKNPDILKWLGEHKPKDQVICGFAMETEHLLENAREKLEGKHCDMLIANNLFTKGAGFQTDTNVASLLLPDKTIQLEKCTKEELGHKILETMSQIEKEKKSC